MSKKTATVIGATGLIGSHLLSLLEGDESFETVRAVVRRPLIFKHPKVQMKLVDFTDYESLKMAIDGSDAVFCAVGTTQKKVAGDKAAYRKVDYDIPVAAARASAETHCPSFSLVSSVGANADSKNFYLNIKGEVEKAVQQYPIPSVAIFRPSVLIGKHPEFRLGEKISQGLASFFAFLLVGSWEKYRPVDASSVAKAMVQAEHELEKGHRIFEFASIRQLVNTYNVQAAIGRPHLVK